jgi:hypothetical protein
LTVAFGYGDGDFRPPIYIYGMFSLQLGGIGGLDHYDADNDGDIDIVGGAYAADDVEVFLNNGNRTFARAQKYGVGGAVTGVRAGDFDGDGATDVVANLGTEPPLGGAVALLRNVAGRVNFADVGAALAGGRGTPRLIGAGRGLPGSTATLRAFAVPPAAPLAFVVGLTAVNLPLLGGTLVPAPDVVIPTAAGAAGTSALSFTWPAGVAPGTTFHAQAWALDAGGPQGFAATNAVRARQL